MACVVLDRSIAKMQHHVIIPLYLYIFYAVDTYMQMPDSVQTKQHAPDSVPGGQRLDLITRRVQPLTDPRPLGQFMHTLSEASDLPVEHGVFVLGQHLRFCRHLSLPSLK